MNSDAKTGDFELSKVYDPKQVEAKWYQEWLKQGYFHATVDARRPAFSIVIPPPNVTGSLHMGHALDNTLQDILVRYKRMKGFNVCWMPGTDHAGIATQNVVERELKKEGKRRQDLGREKFLERVWQWKEQHGSQIIRQLKRLGASCDWERERFTMDEGLSRAVREAFVTLYEQKLIERDLYLINWCPRCHTALSDLEVEHRETKGSLWYIRYPIVGARHAVPLQDIIVATTRPETMLGDTAVAVHPDDKRYQGLVGRKVMLPLVNREIPIIADHRVDQEFGTGAVKVTPAHDFNDFVFGNDHQLPRINIFTPDARINDEGAAAYRGLDRLDARKKIVEDLEAGGFLERIEDHKLSVGECYRCHTVVEPYLSLQWFVRTKPLAEKALQAVREGKTKFFPENWQKNYEQWMETIQDWCVSRQIWWGHRIPAWYCRSRSSTSLSSSTAPRRTPSTPASRLLGRLVSDPATTVPNRECAPIVSREIPTKCPACGSTELEQDPDVLDTWFSSSLWPFSTFGWPDKTPELKYFYPTSVLVTGFDIIFFWVARMMMMGLKFMGEVPFRHVHIHALVRDAQGQKMSKSKGNVIDPLTIMDKFGTDAFRFTLAALAVQGRDIKLADPVIEGYRNFCNKIWNASRFVLSVVGAGFKPAPTSAAPLREKQFSPYDKWILTRLAVATGEVAASIEGYDFNKAAHAAYHFFWDEFCDWYLEYSKTALNQEVLGYVLENALRMLHPFAPFITEEIWQKLHVGEEKTIQFQTYPDLSYQFEEAKQVVLVNALVTEIRTIRGENLIPHKSEIEPIFYVEDKRRGPADVGAGLKPAPTQWLHDYQVEIKRLTNAKTLCFADTRPVPKGMAHAVVGLFDVYVPLAGLIDFDLEKKRLTKELEKLAGDMARVEAKLGNKNFIDHAPAEVVEEERLRREIFIKKKEKLTETLRNLT